MARASGTEGQTDPHAHARSDSRDGGQARVADLLRSARLARDESLRDIAGKLRIRLAYLEAIEDGRMHDLPGPAYAVGFVRAYAKYLDLNTQDIVARFKAESRALDGQAELVFPEPMPSGRVPGFAMLFVAVLLGGLVYGGWLYVSAQDRPMAEVIPEVPARLMALVSGEGEPAATPATPDGETPDAAGADDAPADATPAAEESDATTTARTEAADSAADADTAQAPAASPESAAGGDRVASQTAAAQTEAAQTEAGEPDAARTDAAPAADTGPDADAGPDSGADATADAGDAAPAAPESEAQPVETPETAELSDSVATTEPAEPVEPAEPTTPGDTATAPDADATTPRPPLRESVPEAPEPAADADATETAARESAPSEAAGDNDPAASTPTDTASGATGTTGADDGGADTDTVAALPGVPEAEDAPAADNGENKAVYGAPPAESRIAITARVAAWVEVTGPDGDTLIARLLRAGETYRAPDREGITLVTGNAGGLEVVVDGERAPDLGPLGSVRRNVPLDPETLKAGVAAGG